MFKENILNLHGADLPKLRVLRFVGFPGPVDNCLGDGSEFRFLFLPGLGVCFRTVEQLLNLGVNFIPQPAFKLAVHDVNPALDLGKHCLRPFHLRKVDKSANLPAKLRRKCRG